MIKMRNLRGLINGTDLDLGSEVLINPDRIEYITAATYTNAITGEGISYSCIRIGGQNFNIPILFSEVDNWLAEVTKKRPLNIKSGGNI